MYTIYINEKPLILAQKPFQLDKDTKIIKFEKSNSFFDDILLEFNQNNEISICVYHDNVTDLWNYFSSQYKTIEAAGGLVRNRDGEILFVKRFGIWDLPKGKIEKNEGREEAAIREVEEECHLFNLKIEKFLTTTYHIYYTKNGNPILKIVYWYTMLAVDHQNHLVPQLEEGIEEVCWKNEIEMEDALKSTYQNIRLLFQEA